jgi:hypothetical protein
MRRPAGIKLLSPWRSFGLVESPRAGSSSGLRRFTNRSGITVGLSLATAARSPDKANEDNRPANGKERCRSNS